MNETNMDWMQRRFNLLIHSQSIFKPSRWNNRHCWLSRLIGVFISIEFVMSFVVLLNHFFPSCLSLVSLFLFNVFFSSTF